MKTSKTIATICAVSMAATMMTLPVQAKTYPTKSETITMADTVKSTDEYKDFKKDLKVTVHTPEEFTQAYLYANMMCAKSLKVSLAKDYKMACSSVQSEIIYQRRLISEGMLYGYALFEDSEFDDESMTMTYYNFGDVMSYFTYVYRTGDTTEIPKNYEGMYAFFAAGVDSCTSDADSITDVADNICKWFKSNYAPSSGATFTGRLGKSGIRRTADGKMILNCEGCDYVFRTMLSMAGYTAWKVFGDSPISEAANHHVWSAIKVDDEYRYYDAGWSTGRSGADYMNRSYKEMLKLGYVPWAWYRDKDGIADFKSNPTQEEVEVLFIDWRY